jgi:hypothetical protein
MAVYDQILLAVGIEVADDGPGNLATRAPIKLTDIRPVGSHGFDLEARDCPLDRDGHRLGQDEFVD